MPALSPTMTQGNVGAWQKQVGYQLSVGDVLVEIETDKAQMDYEFQEDGYLAKILLEAGSKDVPVGKAIGVYVEDEGDVAAFADFSAEDAGGAPEPAAAEKASKDEPKTETAPAEAPAPKKSEAPAASKPAPSTGGRIIASPLAKNIALEKGISLKGVKGTGPNGRITAKDVEAIEPAKPATTTTAAPGVYAAAFEDIPLTNMRTTIAKRLTQSKQTAPDYIVSSTISVSKLLKLRAALNASANGEYKLSVNDILIKGVAAASKAVPAANSHWLDAEGVIRQFNNVDVSVAVATPNGLITPIVKNADAKGLSTISKEIKDLGKRAREGKLLPEEYQGGTITISNLGMNSAVNLFTAIINPPQSTIVAISTISRRAIEDKASETGIAFDDVLTISASFDHRVVDGAVGGEWVKAFKKVLENPLELLL